VLCTSTAAGKNYLKRSNNLPHEQQQSTSHQQQLTRYTSKAATVTLTAVTVF
jgi:hypothetical protein